MSRLLKNNRKSNKKRRPLKIRRKNLISKNKRSKNKKIRSDLDTTLSLIIIKHPTQLKLSAWSLS
jgi:hypothetical protein